LETIYIYIWFLKEAKFLGISYISFSAHKPWRFVDMPKCGIL